MVIFNDLILQECETLLAELTSLRTKVTELENKTIDKGIEKDLRSKLDDLETQLTDRNKVSQYQSLKLVTCSHGFFVCSFIVEKYDISYIFSL